MLASSGSGPAKLSPIIVGLQALALVALVLWLVLYHGSQVGAAPKAKKGANKSRAHAPAADILTSSERERERGETDGELVWIGNETSTADEPLSYYEDPFSLVHFHVCLPSGHTHSKKLKPSSRPPHTQPVELVFHSSWLFTLDALSLHISRDGVSAFRGSYLNQSGSNSNDGLSQLLWPQAVETRPLELWDRVWEVLGLWSEVIEPRMPDDESPHSSSTSHSDHNNIYAAFRNLRITISELCAQLLLILASTPNAGGATARETL